MKNFKIYSILFLFIIPYLLSAQSNLVLTESQNVYKKFSLDYLLDPIIGDPEEIKKIFQSTHIKKTDNTFSLGYQARDIWFHLTILNPTQKKKKYILELSEQFYKNVDLYEINNTVFVEHNGLSIPLDQRKIESRNPAFELTFKPNETKDIYLHLTSNYSIYGGFYLKSPKAFVKNTQTYTYLYLLYFGAIIGLLIYTLFLFVYLRKNVYLYYIGHIVFFTLAIALYRGFLSPYINESLYDKAQIFIPLYFLFLILFTKCIVNTKNDFPRIDKLMNFFILISMVNILLLLSNVHSGYYFMNIAALIVLPLLLLVSLYVTYIYKGITLIYFAAILIFTAGMIAIALLTIGFIDYHFLITNIPAITSFLEIMLFSLLLAYKINMINIAGNEAEKELSKHQKTEKSRLFQEVAAKTKALNQANRRLQKELEEKKKLEEHLKLQATTDSLTGLLNRRAFIDEFEKELTRTIRHHQTLSCLIIDIDHFKQINDTYGHHVGDLVIKSIAEYMQQYTRTVDSIGRIGGEEFAILMPNTEYEDAYLIADRLRDYVAKNSMTFNHHTIHITISIGLTKLSEDEETINTIMQRADAALYHAKRNGRNQVCSL